MRRILVVGPSWIGDTILAQPLLKLLHARHDSLALDVLGPRWTLPVLERMPEVRRAIGNPVGHGELRLAAQRRIARELAQEGYDQAVVLQSSTAGLYALTQGVGVGDAKCRVLEH